MNKKIIYALAAIVLLICGYYFMNAADGKPVIIYSTMEDFREVELKKQIAEKYPDIEVSIQHYSTGDCAAKLKTEGNNVEADIILGLEAGYLELMKDMFANLNDYDTTNYLEGLNPKHNKYRIWDKYSGVILVDRKMLKDKGMPVPQGYSDLINPIYKDSFIMPDPKTSGTAYMFLFDQNKRLGETKAEQYFAALSKNTRQFTASGSSPINSLVKGECLVAWGIINKAVSEINKGANIDIIVPEGGAPYSLEGIALISGKEKRENVKQIFDFLYNDFIYYDKEHFSPDQIFKSQECKVPNYPKNIKYSDMSGIEDMKTKEHLLNNWKY